MTRKVASISLLAAWLCASGAMLDVAQVAAWARMFAGYARTESLTAAACETFDPGKPCAVCCALSKAREAGSKQAPAVAPEGLQKIVLILERAAPVVIAPPRVQWPAATQAAAPSRVSDVPLPPPRADLA